jgi:GT2 family glycosyltransferase
VSIIIPNKDYPEGLARCIDSIRRSSFAEYEILLVENRSVLPETFTYYEQLRTSPDVQLLIWDQPFNYAAINNFAVAHTRGEVLLFLNNDVEAINADWLERLLEHALRPEVGAVGAKLYYPDNTIQYAGYVLGLGHVHQHFPRDSAGYAHRLVIAQNLSAVTGACMMTRKDVFEAVQGFDEQFALDFNDIDLCLKMRKQGYRILWTPHAELCHFESKTRGRSKTPAQELRFQQDQRQFRARWATELSNGDPYYNRNLCEDVDFSLWI